MVDKIIINKFKEKTMFEEYNEMSLEALENEQEHILNELEEVSIIIKKEGEK